MISANARFAVMAVALAGASLFLHTRTRNDVLPPGKPLSSLPLQFGDWLGADIPFVPRTLANLGPGEFVQRTYQEQKTGEPYVDLYLAHRPNRVGLESHLPTDCLIGSGWALADSGTTTLSLPGSPLAVNRYVITRGSDRQLVLFWFWVHGRSVASEDRADFYLTLDSLRLNRNDYALVRINTPLVPGEGTDDAQRRLLSFAAQVTPVLDNYISN